MTERAARVLVLLCLLAAGAWLAVVAALLLSLVEGTEVAGSPECRKLGRSVARLACVLSRGRLCRAGGG